MSAIGNKADIATVLNDVRFWGYSGHQVVAVRCPLMTKADMSGPKLLPCFAGRKSLM
jgi:hypothetical protein